MPTLTCEISQSLFNALTERQRETGEPLGHIVMTALAEALKIDHSTVFQVSTSGAIVEGITQGAVTIDELAGQGDLGLGTFDDFDGEMVAIDGCFFQIRPDGKAVKAAGSMHVPFATVTRFVGETPVDIEAAASLDELLGFLDKARHSDNVFFAVRVDGQFAHVKARTVVKADGGARLLNAASNQVEFEFADIHGTIVGFWTPDYAKAIGIPGWHLHFLTEDRTAGGHLLACAGGPLAARLEPLADFRLAMPETAAFLQADLSHDPGADLDKAEKDG